MKKEAFFRALSRLQRDLDIVQIATDRHVQIRSLLTEHYVALKPGSAPHEAIQKIVLDKRLLNDVKKITKCHCGCCTIMPSEEECICCQEEAALNARMDEFNQTILGI
ncbi:uncharacterized protein [Oscarella lobularis]|uniref:uncharacterized protein n=1 Tax=Oscarella lobularis TaxID=121494 RepID=UPI003313B431